jgi:DNA-binding PucR family transcriptional regulator
VQFAELTARLRAAGILTDDPVFVEDHLDALIVHRDSQLLEALRQQALAPLAGLTRPVRERLSETLAAWLRHMGDRQAVAAELHIHPQTVRYRMTQLHDLFGSALDDPAVRSRLTLALAWGTAAAPNCLPAGSPEAFSSVTLSGSRGKAG